MDQKCTHLERHYVGDFGPAEGWERTTVPGTGDIRQKMTVGSFALRTVYHAGIRPGSLTRLGLALKETKFRSAFPVAFRLTCR